MIDIHCHILPALDDGPETIEEALKMARVAVNDGIRTIVATPHAQSQTRSSQCGGHKTSPGQILNEVERFNRTLREERISLTVLPGSDVPLDCNILDDIKNHKVMTVNNNPGYIMLELPSFGVPRNLPDLIWELKLSGITPIFSHPERNEAIQENIDMLYDFIMQGALSQITAMSLTGEFGKRPQKCAVSLLKRNLAHIIATDAHSVRRRPAILSRALEAAGKIVGISHALEMVTGIPDKIIKGEPLHVPEPAKKKNRFFHRAQSIGTV